MIVVSEYLVAMAAVFQLDLRTPRCKEPLQAISYLGGFGELLQTRSTA